MKTPEQFEIIVAPYPLPGEAPEGFPNSLPAAPDPRQGRTPAVQAPIEEGARDSFGSKECPQRCPRGTHELLTLLTRRWTMHILWVLSASGPTRFGALRRQIDGISSRFVSVKLPSF
jgi:hypothetical protein